MSELTLTGLCGALRAGSSNRLLMAEAIRRFGPARVLDTDLRLPLFDEDIQTASGIPPEVQLLADQIAQADAVIVVTPEYNKGVSGVLKNALDWVSRVEGNPWKDKPVAVMSAAAGRAGGERAQEMLRWCLNPFRPRVLSGPELMLADGRNQWDADGRLVNERSAKTLDQLMSTLRQEAIWIRERNG
ncbi:NAD(P)H-dependent oxidoreductase [Mesobacterium sp. TK19101]|uniref:NAD(P)H-dependent oxidoreductase n=1 Tax=Mesobacterium hydrothermale TaxID=3111907 RepID=A0ABU6HGE4_9RHOB|nr:NAD(P)H-dependent oxidoreductase [Mesobacterium sp. TK19101]MEC3860920.1 NAD(P)H-dependent oxidoreductase [Mesobacterium sp. TK19101]